MTRKTAVQKDIIRRRCRFPLFWQIISDVPHCMIIKNWITGETKVLDK